MKLWPIPAGAKPRKCRRCPAMLYDVQNPNSGKLMPLGTAATIPTKAQKDLPTGAYPPTADTAGMGYSHFADCPEAAHFRRPKQG
jgi:hypothetical protein